MKTLRSAQLAVLFLLGVVLAMLLQDVYVLHSAKGWCWSYDGARHCVKVDP